MAQATLTINSKNYGAWSLRGWLLCKMSGLDFEEHVLRADGGLFDFTDLDGTLFRGVIDDGSGFHGVGGRD